MIIAAKAQQNFGHDWTDQGRPIGVKQIVYQTLLFRLCLIEVRNSDARIDYHKILSHAGPSFLKLPDPANCHP